MLSDFEPPSDPEAIPAWLLAQEEEIAALVVRRLTAIIDRSLTAFTSTLTAAGDPSVFDSIPVEWSRFVNTELSDRLGGMYLSGGVSAWIQAPGTEALSEATATAWTEVVNQQAVSYAQTATNRLTGPVSDSIWNDLKLKVSKAIETGASTERLTAEIQTMSAFATYRAETIARTEVNGAYNAGTYESNQTLGDVGPVEKYWIATGDDRTRETHREADGQVRAFADPFSIGGSEMLYPHDPAGPAKEIVNCRCVLGYLYPGMARPDGTIVPEVPGSAPAVEEPKLSDYERTVVDRGIPPDDEPWTRLDARIYLEARHPQIRWANEVTESWDPLVTRSTARWADDMAARYPREWSQMRLIGEQQSLTDVPEEIKGRLFPYNWSSERHMAHAYTQFAKDNGIGVISVNPKYARDYNLFSQEMRKARESGWFFGETVEDILVHEFGHIWDGLIGAQVATAGQGGIAAFGTAFTVEGFGTYSNFTNWLVRDWAMPKLSAQGSIYGGSKPVEAIAEAFLSRHKGLANDATKMIDALELAAGRVVFAPVVSYDKVSQKAAMEVVDEILKEAGIRARPKGWKQRMTWVTEAIERGEA